MKIDFEITDGVYTLKDAIHLPDDHTYTEQEIESMKQQRFNNFVLLVTTPSEEISEEINNGN